MKIETVGTIQKTEKIPNGATLASIDRNGNVQGFYKIENIKYNDRTNKDNLMYFSFLSNTWVHSCNEIKDMTFKQIVE